jgi:predicted nucleotidyltransferase
MLDALFPRTKQRVLAMLFGQPDRAFGMMELIRLAEAGSGAVQREVERLVASGLVTSTTIGRQKRFTANRDSALFRELSSIVEKTGGVLDILRAALLPLEASIKYAVLFGSVAKETDRGTSDIDVLVVADDLPLETIYAALEPAEKRLDRRVSPTVYTSQEFIRRRKSKHVFLSRVLSGEHAVLLGSEDAVTAR